jgi:hypothetical protein
MSSPTYRWYVGGWFLLVVFWCAACTGARDRVDQNRASRDLQPREITDYYGATYRSPLPAHYFDKTEVDLERGRPEPASRYHRPRGAHMYSFDKTQVDLGKPLAASAGEERPPASPASRDASPEAPMPGGDR